MFNAQSSDNSANDFSQISQFRYIIDKTLLKQYGFSESQAERIIFNHLPQSAIVDLENLTFSLTSPAFGFSHEHLTELCLSNGGMSKLLITLDYYLKLMDLRFTADSFTRLLTNNQGIQHFEAIHYSFHALTELGFNSHQLLTIIEMPNGCSHIKSIKDHLDAIKSLNLSVHDLFLILSNAQRPDEISQVIQYSSTLINLNIVGSNIFTLIYNHPNINVLQKIHELHTFFNTFNIKAEQIIRLCQNENDLKHLFFVKAWCNTLIALNINPKIIIQASSNPALDLKAITFHAKQALCIHIDTMDAGILSNTRHLMPEIASIGFHIKTIINIFTQLHLANDQVISNLLNNFKKQGIQIEEIVKTLKPNRNQSRAVEQAQQPASARAETALDVLVNIMEREVQRPSLSPFSLMSSSIAPKRTFEDMNHPKP
jgi:hypothetical protein